MARDNNPDRLDDGARAEAEMNAREAPSYGEPVAFADPLAISNLKGTPARAVYLSKVGSAIYSMPLYTALPAPQGDDGLADRLRNYGLSHMKGMPAIIDEAASALHSQAAEIAGLKAELALADKMGLDEARVSLVRLERAEAAEAKLASAMKALGSEAVLEIATERRRQMEVEGWTPEHDDSHANGEMARAAGLYALIAGADATDYRNARDGYSLTDYLAAVMKAYWPWERSWFKATNRRRDLVKAGALVVAELDRLKRARTTLSNLKGPAE